MAAETFEQVLTAAQADGAFTPAWKKFVNTRFFVPVVPSDSDSRKFTLHVQEADGKRSVTISEVRERMAAHSGNALIAMSGADVVRRLQAEAGILVALSDRAFGIANERVEWLRKGIEASQARAAEKAKQTAPGGFPALDAVAVSASAPVPVPATVPVPAPASAPAAPAASAAPVMLAKAPPALSPVARNQVGVLDVAALKPRNITMPKIGLEFFVPGEWTESATTTGLRFTDQGRRTTVEASGFHRPNLSMAQWLDMRLTLVGHEMRYLTQDGQSYPFEGESWRSRVNGMATEFTGTFPGDDFESRYLVACVWTDGVLAAITIRAPADVFEQNRALYKWLLGRVDMNQSAATIYSPPTSQGEGGGGRDWADGVTPPIFGFSLAGRLGRARVMAYTFPMGLAGAVVGILAAVLLPFSKVIGGIVLVGAVAALAWCCLRLMVLRMHDVNLSGKWLLGAILTVAIATVTKNFMLLGLVSVVVWIGSMVIYCLLPGTDGDNNYGEPPGPNSTLVKVGAVLFVLMQLAQIAAVSSGKYNSKFPFPRSSSSSSAGSGSGSAAKAGKDVLEASGTGVVFTAGDGSFSVTLPGAPEAIELPQEMLAQMGGVQLRQFHLSAENNVYMVQVIDYGDTNPGNRFDVMDSMQESLVGKQGKLIESGPIVLKGGNGRQVKVQLPGGGVRGARMALVGSKFCVVSITAPDGAQAAAAMDAFLLSFKLN